MKLGLEGRAALVLGGSSGLGRGCAQALHGEGAQVAIASRDRAKLEKAAAGTGGVWFEFDSNVAGQAGDVVRESTERFGKLDVLVVSGGGPPPGELDDFSLDDWKAAYQSLWLSTVEAVQAALPGMKERRWGRIVLVASIAAREPVANLLLSNSLRAGLLGFINSTSRELAPHGITINAILPGYFDTPRLDALGRAKSELPEKVPAGRLGDPREFGELAAFLASERAGYLTGQAIAIDGGLSRGI